MSLELPHVVPARRRLLALFALEAAVSPLPLSASDGTIYAYVCGVCRHVGPMGSLLRRAWDEDVREFADQSRAKAEACCRCRTCGAALTAAEGRFRCARCVTKKAEAEKSAVAPPDARPRCPRCMDLGELWCPDCSGEGNH